MRFQIKKFNAASGQATLEILVIRVAGQWLALRSARQLRVASFEAGQLGPGDPLTDRQTGRIGYLNKANVSLPVYDLAFLLGLKAEPALSDNGQIIVQTWPGSGTAGFTIEMAQEIQRAPLTALRQLPEIVRRPGITPLIWAIWLRPDGELIPLLDLTFVPGTKISLSD